MWTVTGVRPCTEAKLTPESVSCPGAMSCPGIMWTDPYIGLIHSFKLIRCSFPKQLERFLSSNCNLSFKYSNIEMVVCTFIISKTKGLFTWTRDSSLPQGNSLTPGSTLPRCTVWRLWLFTWVFCCPGATSRGGLPVVQHRVTRLAEVTFLHVNRTQKLPRDKSSLAHAHY